MVSLAAVIACQIGLVTDLRQTNYVEGPILAFIERMPSEPISAAWANQPPYSLSRYGPPLAMALAVAVVAAPNLRELKVRYRSPAARP